MFLAAAVPFIVLASTIVADPILVRNSHRSLPLMKRVKSTGTGRHHHLLYGRQNYTTTNFTVNLGNLSTYYEVGVSIGDPATNYNLLVDTGNPFTWVGARTKYVTTSSSMKTINSMNVIYGYGNDTWSMNGMIYTDHVVLGGNSDVSVYGQAIGVTQGPTLLSILPGVDGFLGMGPTNMTTGSVHPVVTEGLRTVPDNIYLQHLLTSDAFSLYFQPVNESSLTFGELSIGSFDTDKFIAPILFVPVSTTSPANGTWSVDVNITYGGSAIFNNGKNSTTPCMVDSKSPYNYFPSDAFYLYISKTGATPDPETGLFRLPSEQYKNLQPFFVEIFNLNSQTPGNNSMLLEVIPNAQILPRALTQGINGTSEYVYLAVKDIGSPLPDKPRCVLGIPFLERFYTCFNSTSQLIGFASTSHTLSEAN